ncbi:EthD domain-containing protein [Candidatus Poriferisodalis sp.]|uniref:EthD domain-containing protein n=1 Tax=Candidatus Poriferisodalis sp. TaxID=3101277 RepID=UPI003B5278E9
MHELVVTGNDPEAAAEVAASVGGVCYAADPDDRRELPFRTLVRAMTDSADALTRAGTVGTYLAFSRIIRERPLGADPGAPSPGLTAIFPMVHHPDLTHAQGDRHWRDTHAPLALRHHPGMWDYTQLSVVATLNGPSYDGFALVSFASQEDMRERFFGDDHDREVIRADVAKFADMQRSPRRVITTETIYRQRPPVPAVTWPHD